MARFDGIPVDQEQESVGGRFGGIPVATPATPVAPTPDPEQPGILSGLADMVTGNQRQTEQTQTLPDWATMPEMNKLTSLDTWKSALGTLMSGPKETAQVLQANFPNMEVQQDEKGNYLFKSPSNGQWYAYKPGFQLSDAPRAGAAIASFLPAGRATSWLGAGLASGGTQAGIEASQALAGGEFNPGEVITSGITGSAIPAVTNIIKAARTPAAQVLGQVDTPIMMQNVPQQAVDTPIMMKGVDEAAGVTTTVPDVVTDKQFANIASKATGLGLGRGKARKTLAEIAEIDPDAQAAAARLGIDLPTDVFSNSRQVQEVSGLARAIKGSEQSVGWANTITAARKKAEDVAVALDAATNIATVSEGVKQSLGAARADLKTAANKIYSDIDAIMPESTKINMPNTQKTLSAIANDVGEAQFTDAERNLLKLSTDPATTYGGLRRVKDIVGRQMRMADSNAPFGNMGSANLKRLYGAMVDDQINAVSSAHGQDIGDSLRYANQLTAQRKELEGKIVSAFNKDGEGSIATKLTSAIKSGSKGDIKQLNNIIALVPQPLRKEALSVAIMAQARTSRGDFSFGAFESLYQGLRKNTPVYAAIAKEIGPESEELLRSLYVVSKRINTAENTIPKTGIGLSPLFNTMTAQGVIGKVLEPIGAATAGAARVVPGVGGVIANAITSVAKTDKTAPITAASKLIASPEFSQLLADIATRGAEKAAASSAIRKTVISPKFAAYANRVGIPNGIRVREQWLRDAILAGKQFNQEQDK